MTATADAELWFKCRNCECLYRRATPRQSTLCSRCKNVRGKPCTVCGGQVTTYRRIRCDSCIKAKVNARTSPGPVDGYTRYEDDAACQRFVAEHPDGGTLEEVGQAIGVTRERARRIEAVALKRLVLRLAVAGVSVEDLAHRLGHALSGERG